MIINSYPCVYIKASSKEIEQILILNSRYGQLSGLVEPIAGVLGALLVGIMNPILPYALAFAAGAMVYVVIDDIIPEAQTW